MQYAGRFFVLKIGQQQSIPATAAELVADIRRE